MFLRTLALTNYGVFQHADFDLTTDADHPLVVISGNNGAGKTSILEAIRVALHGRRAFDIPMGEAEYIQAMTNRFNVQHSSTSCSVKLHFDYIDNHRTRSVIVERAWALKRQRVAETLHVTLDGTQLAAEDSDDLLTTIVPPEIARYFFFDGERIRELAEWDAEDEAALFQAVGDLLGLGILGQLRLDLTRIASNIDKGAGDLKDAVLAVEDAESLVRRTSAALRALKSETRKLRGALDRARAEVKRLGALQHAEIAVLENELGELTAERRGLIDEAQRAAADIMPLLCAKTLRARFGKEIDRRRHIEDREIVAAFLSEHARHIAEVMSRHGLKGTQQSAATTAIVQLAYDGLVTVSDASLPPLSRVNALWMQRVIERELPEMHQRLSQVATRLAEIDGKIEFLQSKRNAAPTDDPASEAVLLELEEQQRLFFEHEVAIEKAESADVAAREALSLANDEAKAQRLATFRQGRLRIRERLIGSVLEALPTLSERLQSSKEVRFAQYLKDALLQLWHKSGRLSNVTVSFSQRRISLFDAFGEIKKRDLSAGEKQLFAIAFIYALAKLSGRQMPFVIDTPLGRLDQAHRRRFISEFLPNASHQVLMLSTDSEIVGTLYEDIRPMISHHHELANYNGGVTEPVALASA